MLRPVTVAKSCTPKESASRREHRVKKTLTRYYLLYFAS